MKKTKNPIFLFIFFFILIWIFQYILTSWFNNKNKCYKIEDWINAEAYIFHHILPDKFVNKRDPVEYWNSVSPNDFDTFLNKLKIASDNKLLYLSNFIEIESFYKKNCFPSKKIKIVTIDDWGKDNYEYWYPIIKKYKIPVVLSLISESIWSKWVLSEDNIKEMLNSWLITIWSHWMKHKDITSISNSEKSKEICKSKVILEKRFWTKVNSFIYPYGKSDKYSSFFLRNCGYTFWVLSGNKWVHIFDKYNLYNFYRIKTNRKFLKEINYK
jgi:peptidoglycan/xylan/chitin deacetylase (PgdA/CDA1 family)